MINFELLKEGIDVWPLVMALEEYDELWGEKTFREQFFGTPHEDTNSIYLRWAPEDTAESIQGTTKAIDMPALKFLPEAALLIKKAMTIVGATKLGRALIVRLKPGGKIKPHEDDGVYADHFERFHLCLFSEDALFCVGADSFEMHPGELWWFNHKRVHSAENRSKSPRINMIIDMVAPKYRRERV